MIVEATGYLSPATVLAPGESGYVQVAIGKDEVVWARMAMAVPYVPEAGDEVLVIGSQSAEAYVIGVLAGHGTVTGARFGGGEREAQSIFDYHLPADVFPATASYVALGHLHRTQEVPARSPPWVRRGYEPRCWSARAGH